MPAIIKISILPLLTDLADGDYIPVLDVSEPVEANQTKRVAVSNVRTATVAILSAVYPVGSIYVAAVSTNPATLFGFGTWAAFGAGRTMVGIDAAQTEFDTLLETGGAKTHTMIASEMPVHTHVQNAHNHTYHDATNPSARMTNGTGAYTNSYDDTLNTSTSSTVTAVNQNAGSGGAHNNLQPYIVVYMWRRTA